MKMFALKLAASILIALLIATNPAWAQKVGQTVGRIGEFGPDTIAIRSPASGEVVRYVSSQSTTYFDETGAPLISVDMLKIGVPVTVDYIHVGDHLVASRVVLGKAPPVVPAGEKKTAGN